MRLSNFHDCKLETLISELLAPVFSLLFLVQNGPREKGLLLQYITWSNSLVQSLLALNYYYSTLHLQAVVAEPRRLHPPTEGGSAIHQPGQDHLWQHWHHQHPKWRLQTHLTAQQTPPLWRRPPSPPVGLERETQPLHRGATRWNSTAFNFVDLTLLWIHYSLTIIKGMVSDGPNSALHISFC